MVINRFINLEERESNMAKQRILDEELRRVTRLARTTRTGLLAEASTSNVTASPPPGYDASDDMDDIQSSQSSRELQA